MVNAMFLDQDLPRIDWLVLAREALVEAEKEEKERDDAHTKKAKKETKEKKDTKRKPENADDEDSERVSRKSKKKKDKRHKHDDECAETDDISNDRAPTTHHGQKDSKVHETAS